MKGFWLGLLGFNKRKRKGDYVEGPMITEMRNMGERKKVRERVCVSGRGKSVYLYRHTHEK